MLRSAPLVLLTLVACSSRPASLLDASAPPDGAKLLDWPAIDAGPVCTSLIKVGQVLLEEGDTSKSTPQVIFDGEQFGVFWHSQGPQVSSTEGELRFARVDSGGETRTPQGISLGDQNGSLRASIANGKGEYAVLRRPASGTPRVELTRIDRKAQPLGVTTVKGDFLLGGVVPGVPGYRMLLISPQGISSQQEWAYVVLDLISGEATDPFPLGPESTILRSIWLAPDYYNYVVSGSHSVGHIAWMHRLSGHFGEEGEEMDLGQGVRVYSPSFAVLRDGYAAAYVANEREVEAEVFSADGKKTGHHELSRTGADARESGDTSLAWTGVQLIVAHPGAVDGEYRLQILDATGAPVGAAVSVPSCLGSASEVSIAWGRNRIAVASVSRASGATKSGVCVTLMECR